MCNITPVTSDLNPMNFTENQQGNAILEKLRLQKENKRFCDVVLCVGKTKFYLHRNVLATFSPYFEKVLFGSKFAQERFTIVGHDPEVFQYFVNYIYTGSIIIHSNNVTDLLRLSHRLSVSKLTMYCAEYLERNLDMGNCLKVKDCADKYDLHSLSKQATTFIRNNMDAIMNQRDILQLDVKKLHTLLLDKELAVTTNQIMHLILDWVRYDIQSREKQMKPLLSLIDFTTLDIHYINELLENESLFATSDLSLYLVLKMLNTCGLSFSKFVGIFDALNHKYANLILPDVLAEAPRDEINKVSSAMQRRKKKRLLRKNPIARLNALRSALLLRKKSSRKHDAAKKENHDLTKTEALMDTTDSAPLKCHLCEHFSSDTTALEHHLSAVHSREVTYKCGVCGYVCQWNDLYLQHVRGHFPGPPYKCDSCDFVCDKLISVMAHRSVHVEEKTFKCEQCSFRCRTSSSLAAHAKLHNPAGSSSDKANQTSSDRNYVCDLCGFNTKYLSHLIAHKRIHSGDIYRCSYPHCKFTTGKKTQLGSHAKSHQGVRPHCCQICGRGFLEKSHLVRHERIHLEEKPFKCHECDYASSRRDKLKEHQARHHGDNASAKVPYKARPNKKSSQLYQEAYSPGEVRSQPSGSADIQEVLVHNTLATSSVAAYPTFTVTEPHQHSTVSTAALDFHQHPLLSTANRGKDHRHPPQSTAAAVTAAMMLDPRFHHANASSNTYGTPVAGVASAGNPVAQPGHHVEYPTALMSLF